MRLTTAMLIALCLTVLVTTCPLCRYHRSERSAAYAKRALRFPETADLSSVKAKYENGTLSVEVRTAILQPAPFMCTACANPLSATDWAPRTAACGKTWRLCSPYTLRLHVTDLPSGLNPCMRRVSHVQCACLLWILLRC